MPFNAKNKIRYNTKYRRNKIKKIKVRNDKEKYKETKENINTHFIYKKKKTFTTF